MPENQCEYALWEIFLKKQKNNLSRNEKKPEAWMQVFISNQKSLWSKSKYKDNKKAIDRKEIKTWKTSLLRSYRRIHEVTNTNRYKGISCWNSTVREESKRLYSWYNNNSIAISRIKNDLKEIDEVWMHFLTRVSTNIKYSLKKKKGWDKVIHNSAQYLRKRSYKENTIKNKVNYSNYLKVSRGILLASFKKTIESPWEKKIKNSSNYLVNQFNFNERNYGKKEG